MFVQKLGNLERRRVYRGTENLNRRHNSIFIKMFLLPFLLQIFSAYFRSHDWWGPGGPLFSIPDFACRRMWGSLEGRFRRRLGIQGYLDSLLAENARQFRSLIDSFNNSSGFRKSAKRSSIRGCQFDPVNVRINDAPFSENPLGNFPYCSGD